MKTSLELAMQSIISAGWNVTSSGDVESPTGHFAVIERPANTTELEQILETLDDAEEREAFTAQPTGFYTVTETDQGNIYIEGPTANETALQWFNQQSYAYGQWADQEFRGL